MQGLIKGHSGDRVEIINSSVIRKLSDKKRLLNNCLKQVAMVHCCRDSGISVPPVLNSGKIDEKYFFDMKYVHGDNVPHFLNSEPINEINSFINKILSFIKKNIDVSTNSVVNQVLLDKIKEIKDKLKDSRVSLIIDSLSDHLQTNEVVLPIGPCHGDLTFSNIIISRSSAGKVLNFIDFLDSFLDTPLQDVVKIRQDTFFKWTLGLYSGALNNHRMNYVFSFLDDKVDKFFRQYDFYNVHYKVYQIINLLRVMPYSNKEKLDYLINNVNIINKF